MEEYDEGLEEVVEFKEHDMMELFEELTFSEKWRKVFDGLKMPPESGEYKFARLQLLRLSAPISAVVVPCIMVVLLMILATFKPAPSAKIEVSIVEPEPIEELEDIEEIIEEPPEPPDPVEVEFDPDVTVDTPNPSPPTDFSPVPAKFDSVAIVKSPVIMKNIYGSRSPGARGSARAAYGGNGATEGAVMRALRWLKTVQHSDGSWDGNGDGAGGRNSSAKAAFTGMALLTYLAHGETPASEEFGDTVERAIRYLCENQKADGTFSARDGHNYTHPIAAYALCEAYGLTKVPMLLEAAEKAIMPIIKGQHPSGGWDYNLKQSARDDTSYMGWCAQALKAAKMAGVLYSDPSLDKAMKKAIDGFKKNAAPSGGFGYCGAGNTGLTGVGVLCMQLLGAAKDPVCKSGLTAMNEWKFAWNGGGGKLDKDLVYYTYYGTQAKFHHGGETWKAWNLQCAPGLVKSQTRVAKEQANYRDHQGIARDIGYWDAPGKPHSGGRVQDTCLCTLQLEVYYRYLPTFKAPVADAVEEKEIVSEDDIKIDFDEG